MRARGRGANTHHTSAIRARPPQAHIRKRASEGGAYIRAAYMRELPASARARRENRRRDGTAARARGCFGIL
eukprot:scaffold403_cov127-Isochrysis_galbana.AAC.2